MIMHAVQVTCSTKTIRMPVCVCAHIQVTFGEAGAKIIRSNMRNGKVDATIPGKFVQAFFGFCDIRNFTECTETLQQEVGVCTYI